MRISVAVLLVILGVTLGDVSGTWSGSFRVDSGDHDVPQLILLKEDGTKVTGTGGPDATERYPISNGQVRGDRVTFELTTGDWKFFYDLKNSGRQMTGKLVLKSANDSQSAAIMLKRSR